MKNKWVQLLGKRINPIISSQSLAFATSSVFFTTSEVIAMSAGGSVRFLLKRRAIAHQSSYHHGFPPRSWRKYFSSSLWFGRKMPNDEDISLLFHLITVIQKTIAIIWCRFLRCKQQQIAGLLGQQVDMRVLGLSFANELLLPG